MAPLLASEAENRPAGILSEEKPGSYFPATFTRCCHLHGARGETAWTQALQAVARGIVALLRKARSAQALHHPPPARSLRRPPVYLVSLGHLTCI